MTQIPETMREQFAEHDYDLMIAAGTGERDGRNR